MKIGIVTFHRAENHGAILQCVSLYLYLKQLGYDVKIIDYRNSVIEDGYRIFPKFQKNLLRYGVNLAYSVLHYIKLKSKKNSFNAVLESMQLTEDILKNNVDSLDLDLYISGSDQLWNPTLTNGFDNIYLLDIENKGIKSTYAMSMGDSSAPVYKDKYFLSCVEKLDFISMREKESVDFFLSALNRKDIKFVLDPVFLLSANSWNEIIKADSFEVKEKYIFLYFAKDDETLFRVADRLADKYNMRIVYLNVHRKRFVFRKFKNKVKNVVSVSPYQFIGLISKASFIVTSSFHATAFSCIYEKDVHILLPKGIGSRVKSITEIFGIENRIYSSYDDFCSRFEKNPISYNTDKFSIMKQNSIDYLDMITSHAKKQKEGK